MSNMSRDNAVVELDDPPAYDYGDKVRARCAVRNDGTFPGKDVGDILAKKGEEGYVVSIGTFLQQFYIYGIEFIESGRRVGMKRKELEAADVFEESVGEGSCQRPESMGSFVVGSRRRSNPERRE